MACELCGTTMPIRRKCEQIVNVNLPRTISKPCFYVHFVINMYIDRKSNYLQLQETPKAAENDTNVLFCCLLLSD